MVCCKDCKCCEERPDLEDEASIFYGYCNHQKTYVMADWDCGEGEKITQ
jgi:hypothetical protein